MTIRPRTFLEHYRRLQTGEAQGVAPVNENIFPDVESALAPRTTGKVLLHPYRATSSEWWGEAVIPRAYIEQQWSKVFDIVEFVNAAELKQHVVLLRA